MKLGASKVELVTVFYIMTSALIARFPAFPVMVLVVIELAEAELAPKVFT